MAQKGEKGTYLSYLDGRTYAEVCKPGRMNNVNNYSDDKIIIEDCYCEDDGRGNVDIYFNIDSEFSDMDGSKNKKLSSSDNIVSEVCIDSRSYVDLPFEIIYDIFLRLPIEDIARCKTVCQTWYNLTREPNFISLLANGRQRILLVPKFDIDCLFLLDNKKCTKIPLKSKLKLSNDYRVASCCNGLLCIASGFKAGKPVFIYNPITGECNELPKQDHKTETEGSLYGFAFDRFSNKYKVVCVYCACYLKVEIIRENSRFYITLARETRAEIITEGEDTWRKLEVPYQVQFSHGSDTVFLDDTFHWMIDRADPTSGSELILALDIHSEKFHTLQLPPVELPNSLSLINYSGSLAFVEFDTRARLSKIWKIVRSETNDTRIRGFTCRYVSHGLRYYCKVLGHSNDRNLIYQANKYELEAMPCNRLGVYIPGKKESILVNMCVSTDSFQTLLFSPTLLSPKALYFPWRWNPRIRIIKVMSRNEMEWEEMMKRRQVEHKEIERKEDKKDIRPLIVHFN